MPNKKTTKKTAAKKKTTEKPINFMAKLLEQKKQAQTQKPHNTYLNNVIELKGRIKPSPNMTYSKFAGPRRRASS